MHTKLSQFCAHFDGIVRPLLAPLSQAIDSLGQQPPRAGSSVEGSSVEGASAAAQLRSQFEELRHQLTTLIDKVESQQAYVLIFGPLKSGKSTLMNAIAASYVSEVSSLPAYPCLVFVRHGKDKKFVLTDYAGKVERLSDPKLVHDRIDAAHKKLADSMRAVEQRGEQFDPHKHLPTAIRRVDVHVDASALESSGAVLVDTPGLYTRMRFGYDRMTREFRNAAACAIFVVKSDTLFLEQVFAEFDQLLDLFSRIFLVVNMDTAKRDVGPFGELTPSLEQKSPQRIIEAFKSLAMSAPLKKAAEAGRVQIYPVDLMNAARITLAGGKAKSADGKPEVLPAGFAKFKGDLDDYLASSEYLKAFLSDSLTRAQSLIKEAVHASQGKVSVQLRNRAEELEYELDQRRDELRRLDTASNADWTQPFERYAGDLAEEVERKSRDQGARVARAMSAAIETWFLSSHSLEWLMSTVWTPLVKDYLESVHQAAQRSYEQSCAQDGAGLDFDTDTARLFRTLDIDVYSLRRSAAGSIINNSWSSQAMIPLDWDAIPIRKRIIDVALFRSENKVRELLLGPAEKPDTKIPSRRKMSMLGEPAKHFMSQFLMQFRRDLFGTTVQETLRRFGQELERATTQEIKLALAEQKPGLVHRIADLESQLEACKTALMPLEALHDAATDIHSKTHALSTQYASTTPDALLEPTRQVVLDPSPARTQDKSKSQSKDKSGRRSRKSHAQRPRD